MIIIIITVIIIIIINVYSAVAPPPRTGTPETDIQTDVTGVFLDLATFSTWCSPQTDGTWERPTGECPAVAGCINHDVPFPEAVCTGLPSTLWSYDNRARVGASRRCHSNAIKWAFVTPSKIRETPRLCILPGEINHRNIPAPYDFHCPIRLVSRLSGN